MCSICRYVHTRMQTPDAYRRAHFHAFTTHMDTSARSLDGAQGRVEPGTFRFRARGANPPPKKKTFLKDIMIHYSTWLRRISFDPTGGGQTRNAKGVKRVTLSRLTPRPGVKRDAKSQFVPPGGAFSLESAPFRVYLRPALERPIPPTPWEVGALARDPLGVRAAAGTEGKLATATDFDPI